MESVEQTAAARAAKFDFAFFACAFGSLVLAALAGVVIWKPDFLTT
jgi:hypothetical protein